MLVLAIAPARAQVQIDITQGVVDPLPIAVTDLYGETPDEVETGREISAVIAANLERSGLFRPIDEGAFIQDPAALQNGPNFPEWRIINAQALVSGSVQRQADGRYRVEFRLWDVIAENQMDGRALTTDMANWRRIAHKISDIVYERITGETGYFDTQIVYVSETGPANARVKRLAIMDQDGADHQFLTDGTDTDLVLTPRFSPTAREITFLAYYADKPQVYLYNIDTGRRELLGNFPGMTFAPRFSPDGNRVIMSMATGGNTEIYTMDLRTRQTRRLTNSPAIETAPSFAPDGTRIAFESDRGGSQQIYVMNADGSNPQRISFGDGSYASPVWSPRGDLIAFTKVLGGRFYIGVMRPDGTGERILAEAFHVEGPTWAPNGRVIAYFSEVPSGPDGSIRQSRLYTVDLTGRNVWQIPTPLDGSDPAWSPLLP
ncbi:MAG TPA: Tol-Pal system beta propeller repeat protein TolB [Alphaproteobacteria bacterium]|nr:Tol-Pal system beta propeller repeat protein TolB [Alphaproteobacteria bacterium]